LKTRIPEHAKDAASEMYRIRVVGKSPPAGHANLKMDQ
jgi:hypothetical protein